MEVSASVFYFWALLVNLICTVHCNHKEGDGAIDSFMGIGLECENNLPKYNFSVLESYLNPEPEPAAVANLSVIEIGYLAHLDLIMVPGAVALSVDKINKDPNVLPGVELRFRYAKLGSLDNHMETITRMTELRDSGVVAFIGPDETCQREALVSSAWNLPMIAFVREWLCTMVYDNNRYIFTCRNALIPSFLTRTTIQLLPERFLRWPRLPSPLSVS